MLQEKICRFITCGEGSFEALALEAFAFQFENVPAYRRLCEQRGIRPGSLASWREVPAVPAVAFKSLELAAAPARVVFRSSGTSRGRDERSVHHQPFPQLYRQAIDGSFPAACLPAEPPLPMLSLIPPRAVMPDSSLSFMIDHVLERWGDAGSRVAFTAAGLDAAAAEDWARELQRPALVLATALALDSWLEALEAADLRLRLAEGSAVFETGGFKGRRREVARSRLLERLQERLGVPAGRVVREYGMTELSSQFYTRALDGGDPDLFLPPPWTRVRIVDPQDLAEVTAGRTGLVAVFDLANLGSAVHLLTEDLGVAEGAGFRLLGRAAGAELRGCSLVVEDFN